MYVTLCCYQKIKIEQINRKDITNLSLGKIISFVDDTIFISNSRIKFIQLLQTFFLFRAKPTEIFCIKELQHQICEKDFE